MSSRCFRRDHQLVDLCRAVGVRVERLAHRLCALDQELSLLDPICTTGEPPKPPNPRRTRIGELGARHVSDGRGFVV